MVNRPALIVMTLLAAAGLAGCTSKAAGTPTSQPTPTTSRPTTEPTSITVDVTLLAKAEAAGTPTEQKAVLQQGGMARGQAHTLSDMISGAAGHGQIAGEVGGRRSTRVVAFFHNATGRYRAIRAGDHVTITPTTTAQLAAAADELISERP